MYAVGKRGHITVLACACLYAPGGEMGEVGGRRGGEVAQPQMEKGCRFESLVGQITFRLIDRSYVKRS